MIIQKPNCFKLNDQDVLFFDIFYNDDKLYLITPIYKSDIIIENIFIENAQLNKIISKDEYEGIRIIEYNILEKKDEIHVEYNNIKNKYTINYSDNDKFLLTITTLFKDDYDLIDIFYNYYTEQGVEYFYLYYNGKINDDIVHKYEKYQNITLIEWDFVYFNYNNKNSIHYSQIAQMHHAIYKFGKNFSKYMIFCDYDEYLKADVKLRDLIKTNYNSYGFLNIWAKTVNNEIPKEFPELFLVDIRMYKFTNRSKCIHKMDSIETIGVHSGHTYLSEQQKPILINLNGNKLFHFINWSAKRYIIDNKLYLDDKTFVIVFFQEYKIIYN